MNEYLKQAKDFLEKTGTKFTCEFLRNDYHFEDDKDTRDIYKITLERGSRSCSFKFGQSLAKSGFAIINKLGNELCRFSVPSNKRELCLKNHGWYGLMKFSPFTKSSSEKFKNPEVPNEYDVLACLIKYDPGDFEDFCSEFGYDTDSQKAERTYEAAKDEYLKLCILFSDKEMEELAEIQ